MMVKYEDLCKIRIMNNPCPLCNKRPEVKDTKTVKVTGDLAKDLGVKEGTSVQICKTHDVPQEE